jgi:hypothetical protein
MFGPMHQVPPEWIAQAGLTGFIPSRSGFRCNDAHTLIALADIEPPLRDPGVTLDANGFNRDRMMRILEGIRDDASMPPILVWETGRPPHRYVLRDGVHRYWASFAIGFTHVPCNIGEPY